MQQIRVILEFIFDLFFGCHHDHLTRPFTLQSHSYKICLDCGLEMPYSVESMRLLHPWEVGHEQKKAQTTEIIPVTVSVLSSDKPYANWKAVA